MLNKAVIYLIDLESYDPDDTIEKIYNSPDSYMSAPDVMIIHDFDEEKFHRIFNSDIFERIQDIMKKYDEYHMWYLGETPFIDKISTKIEIINMIDEYTWNNDELNDIELQLIVNAFRSIVERAINSDKDIVFVF